MRWTLDRAPPPIGRRRSLALATAGGDGVGVEEPRERRVRLGDGEDVNSLSTRFYFNKPFFLNVKRTPTGIHCLIVVHPRICKDDTVD